MIPKGVPFDAGGSLIGGVGVSGSPLSETDEACANAGMDAVLPDLEMDI